jgi:integrase
MKARFRLYRRDKQSKGKGGIYYLELVKRKWPKPVYCEKRAITWDEHQKIIQREVNPERHAFYSMAWHTGASQSDLAHLQAEDIDWSKKIITYEA